MSYSSRDALGHELFRRRKLENVFKYIYHLDIYFSDLKDSEESCTRISSDAAGVLIISDRSLIAMQDDEELWCIPIPLANVSSSSSNRITVRIGRDKTDELSQGSFFFEKSYSFYCKNESVTKRIVRIIESARYNLYDFNQGLLLSWEKQREIEDAKVSLAAANISQVYTAQALAGRFKCVDIFQLGQNEIVDRTDILGSKVRSLKVVGYRWQTNERDKHVKYKVEVTSKEFSCKWIVWRRYSEFLKLRDAITRTLGQSRASLPIPSRLPWRTSAGDIKQRIIGLNTFTKTMLSSEAISNIYTFRFFFTSNVEEVETSDA